jgi:flagellum-specific peptidoglycan hydrolase FlgJ
VASQSGFMGQYQQYAMTAGAATGIPYQVILGQWALESTYGTSDLAIRAKNFAGIKYNSNADFKSGSYAGYNSFSRFVQDYIRVMMLPYYTEVRNASGITETIEAFGRSPYAEDSQYASKLKSIVNINDTSTGAKGNAVAAGGKILNIVMHPLVLVLALIYLMIKKK